MGYDLQGNNWLLTTWNNGSKWYFMPYDLDTVFGLTWNGLALISANTDVLTILAELPNNTRNFWRKVGVAKQLQIKERYSFLKSKGIFSSDNVYYLCKEIEKTFKQKYYKDEQDKWLNIPSKTFTSVEQIISFVNQRLIYLDTVIV